MTTNPATDPVWRALATEAGIASDQIGEGATLLRKLSPESPWTFSRAFFPLSIGIERACKLALHVDSKLSSGNFLTFKEMKAYSHGLDALVVAVDAMNGRRGFDVELPNTGIHQAVIGILDEFATTGRYHHLDDLAGRAVGTDPSKRWWEEVIKPIADLHYRQERQTEDEALADVLGAQVDEMSLVRYAHVTGEARDSMIDVLRDGAKMLAVIPWARMYTLQIARWLGETMERLSWESHRAGNAEIPELHEFFYKFLVDDKSMRTNKTWRPLA